MRVDPTAIAEVMVIVPPRYADERGYFSETFNAEAFAAATGTDIGFVQDNQSLSRRSGTIRGLHFQAPPAAQDKLVRVVTGTAFAVAVDIRKGSPTYATHVSTELTADRGEQIFVPKGFAFGICTTAPDTIIFYKVSAPFSPETYRGIAWDDPALDINWPAAAGDAILSERDRNQPRLADAPEAFRYGES